MNTCLTANRELTNVSRKHSEYDTADNDRGICARKINLIFVKCYHASYCFIIVCVHFEIYSSIVGVAESR